MIEFNKRYFSSNTYANVSFSKFSQYWWANRYYAKIIRCHVARGGTLLEIGCGLGHLLGMLDKDYQATGIDINSWALKQAIKNAPNSRIKNIPTEDIGKFSASNFDVVVIKHVLEHLKNPALVLKKVKRILKPNGWLLFATPNPTNLLRPLKGAQWVGLLDPTHISVKPPEEWKILVKSAGLNTIQIWSDGFWNTPYIPFIPNLVQKFLFGGIGGLQAITGLSFIPVHLGESTIILAQKP